MTSDKKNYPLHAFFVCGSIESYFTYLLRESVTVKCK